MHKLHWQIHKSVKPADKPDSVRLTCLPKQTGAV